MWGKQKLWCSSSPQRARVRLTVDAQPQLSLLGFLISKIDFTTLSCLRNFRCAASPMIRSRWDKTAQRYSNFQTARGLRMHRDNTQPMDKATVLTHRFDRALLYASHVHVLSRREQVAESQLGMPFRIVDGRLSDDMT